MVRTSAPVLVNCRAVRRTEMAMANEKAKILVCEDNAALAGVICFNLVRAGFEVTSVGNGRLALEALAEGRV